MPTPPLPVKRDHAKYTLPLHVVSVRSASIAVLSWNLPRRFGAEEPLATTTEPAKRLPSLMVSPSGPSGFTYRATHSSPNVFFEPAGSSLDSEPMNTRPSASHAMTGSPALAVRILARAPRVEVSSG